MSAPSSQIFATASQFATGMRKLAASVTVITTIHEGTRYGLTASAVTSLSAKPPSLLACVNESATANPIIRSSGIFCVNILASTQADISNAFASADVADRFEYGDWECAPSGAPRLTGAAASFDCQLMDALPGFSHTVFIGLITDITTSKANSLLYADGEYGHFQLPSL